MSASKRSRAWRNCRLSIDSLEERAVPAFDLSIDGDTLSSFHITSTFAGGTTTFTPNATGAILKVDDITAALALGNVVITTGAGGTENGDISWLFTSPNDEFDYTDPTTRTLTIRPDATSIVGDFHTDNILFNCTDNLNLVVDTTQSAADGAIDLLNDTELNNFTSVTLNAGTSIVQLDSSSSASMTNSGNIHITASTFTNITPGFAIISDNGNITVDGAVAIDGSVDMRAQFGNVTVNGAIDSAFGQDLLIYGVLSTVTGSIGSTGPLGNLTIAGGNLLLGGAVSAGAVFVGDGNFDREATLAGPGTIAADVDVQLDGAINPSGSGGTGVMNISGNLTFDGGAYFVNLGATPSIIHVTGDVNINSGSTLGGGFTEGMLPGSGDFKILDFAGDLFGEFDNAPLGQPLIIGSDAVRVTNYGPAATGLTIAQVPANQFNSASGSDADGTAYKIKLSGNGQLVTYTDMNGNFAVVARNTDAKSKIAVTTTANASDDLVNINQVIVNGDLGGFSAPTVQLGFGLGNAFEALPTQTTVGTVKSLSLFSVAGPVVVTDALSSFTVAQDSLGDVQAESIGKVKIGRTLGGFGTWNINSAIGSITAAEIVDSTIQANSIGAIKIIGDKKQHLAGDVSNLTLNVLGNDGTPKALGLGSMTVKGNVSASTLNVLAGNVGTVAVGRFLFSNLYVDFTPGIDFSTDGGFNSANHWKLGSFTTTAKTISDPTNPNNLSFAGSQIAVDTIGTVRLSGLKTDNAGTVFGIRFRTTAASVQVKSADNGFIPLNVNLTPSNTALANDFFFLHL